MPLKLHLPLFLLAASLARSLAADPATPADLFQMTKVWDAHLTLTPEEYANLEPKGGHDEGGGPGGMGRGPRGPGPAMLFTPALMKGDANQDGKLSREEFLAVGEKWFHTFDAAKTGKLLPAQIEAGLAGILPPMSGPGGPGGGGPGGGGPPGSGGPGRGFVAKEGMRNGVAGASGIDFQFVHAALNFNGEKLADVGVRYKGNATYMASRNSLKRSLKVDLNKYVKGQKLAGVATLNLHSDVMDGSWMNEALSYGLYRDAKVPSPRTSYARVYLTFADAHQDEYVGLFSIVENVDKHFAKEVLGTGKGALFKPSTGELFKDLGDDWAKYNQIYDPKTELSLRDQNRVIAFAKLVTSAPDAEFAEKLSSFLDLDEFARYMAVTVWLSTMDSILAMGQNFYVYLDPKTDQFQFLPWDLDQSFGRGPGGAGDTTRLSIDKPWTRSNRFLERVFAVEAFRKLYREHMEAFNNTIFQPAGFDTRIAAIEKAIAPAVEQESKDKAARFTQLAEGKSVAMDGPGGGGPPGRGRGGLSIKEFVKARQQAVADQLAGKPMTPSAAGAAKGGGPGPFLAEALMHALDTDHDGAITHEEFTAVMAKWFDAWNDDHTGLLTEDQLRAGLNRELGPPPGGGIPGGPR